VNILKKQRQNVTAFNVRITASRQENATPSLFETLHIHYMLKGNLEKSKVEKAIQLSLGKYCSVAKILEHTATITSSFEIE
jgi:putative redox protein